MTLYPLADWVQLFAYSGLEEVLSKQLEESPGNLQGLRKICPVEVKSAIIVNRKDGSIESLATEAVIDSYNKHKWDFPIVEGTLFHVEGTYLEYLMRQPFKGWELSTLLPKERISIKEGKVKVLLPPAEYQFDPVDAVAMIDPDFRKDDWDLYKAGEIYARHEGIRPSVMKKIIKAKLEKPPHSDPFGHYPGWPKVFDVGNGRTVVIDHVTGDRLYDRNNFWEVDPEDLIMVNGTKAIEISRYYLAALRGEPSSEKYAFVVTDKDGQLIDYDYQKPIEVKGKVKIPVTA